MTGRSIGVGALAILGAIVALVVAATISNLVAIQMVGDTAEMTSFERSQAIGQARLAVVQLFGGIALLIGLIFTAYNLRIARQAQQVDRFTQAVEQIGHEKSASVRVGGVWALRIVANLDSTFRLPAINVLRALIVSGPSNGVAPADIEAAAKVLGSIRRPGDEALELTDCNLSGSKLSNADFTSAILEGVSLSSAKLTDAVLTRAVLRRANLTGAKLYATNLRGADLTDAIVDSQTDFYDASIDEATILDGIDRSVPKNLPTS